MDQHPVLNMKSEAPRKRQTLAVATMALEVGDVVEVLHAYDFLFDDWARI